MLENNYNTIAYIGGNERTQPAINNCDEECDQDSPQAGDVRSAPGGDLKYLINKILFVRYDGSYSIMDNAAMRINRLNKRLKKWEEIIKLDCRYMRVRIYQIGLSYRPGRSWNGNDITAYMNNVRDYIGKDNLIAYAWVAEMQRRAEVHYHDEIITTIDCRKIPMPDKKGHWKNGSSSRKIVSLVDVGYLTSDYMKKKEQKSNYPKGIRIHGIGLNNKYFGKEEYWALRSVSYPDWLVEKINNEGLINPIIKRAKGGGFVVKADKDSKEYFWKNNEGYVLTGRKARDFLDMEKYKYPIPF